MRLPILLDRDSSHKHRRTVSICASVSLTVIYKEIAVDDVNQTVQLLLHQATRWDFQDKLCKQLAVETEGWVEKQVIRHLQMVDCIHT